MPIFFRTGLNTYTKFSFPFLVHQTSGWTSTKTTSKMMGGRANMLQTKILKGLTTFHSWFFTHHRNLKLFLSWVNSLLLSLLSLVSLPSLLKNVTKKMCCNTQPKYTCLGRNCNSLSFILLNGIDVFRFRKKNQAHIFLPCMQKLGIYFYSFSNIRLYR